MADMLCSVCSNLDYGRFVEAHNLDVIEDLTRPRYLLIKFDDLQAAAMMGCTTCNILNQGVRLFWGDNPEKEDSYDSLLLRRCLDMSLLASRWYAEDSGTNVAVPSTYDIEFFTPESKCFICVTYMVDEAFMKTSLNHIL